MTSSKHIHTMAIFTALSLAACAKSDTTPPADASPQDDVQALDAAAGRDASNTDGTAADGMAVPDGGCPNPTTDCGGECFDLSTAQGHCGSCDHACAESEVCEQGHCESRCAPGAILCDGGCVAPLSDIANCGSCGHACHAGEHALPVCLNGLCNVQCEQGWSDLDADGTCESHCVPSTPPDETCNGRDDDCDGLTDEDFQCVLGTRVGCTTQCGSTGQGTCGNDCRLPDPSLCVPPEEVCNGIDDDCDGVCDEGMECCAGTQESCTTSCGSTGTRTCSAGCQWETCLPPTETCNGEDDDCDGETDEDFVAYECPLDQSTNPNESACNAACAESESCELAPLSTTGDVPMRECSYDQCTDHRISLIRGSANRIEFYRPGGLTGDVLVGAITIDGASSSGEVRLMSCDTETCNPNYQISLIRGNGSTIEVYRIGGIFNDDILVGTISLTGTTVAGEARYRSCSSTGDPPDCNPDFLVSRVTGSGHDIDFYRGGTILGDTVVGTLSLTPTQYVCPLDSNQSCTGNPPSCTITASCNPVVRCP